MATLATVGADGSFVSSSGETLAIIAEDGSTTVAGQELSFDASGALVGGNPDEPRMSLSPADTPAKRMAMALLLLLLL